LALIALAVIGKLDTFLRRPITTTAAAGYHFGVALIGWGAPVVVGWVVGIIITGIILFGVMDMCGYIYTQAKKRVLRFKK